MSDRKRVVVEGWRFVPHSYAVVNHYQCAELARRGDVEVYHVDAPLLDPAWKASAELISPEADAAVRAIGPPPAGLEADAWLSIQGVYRVKAARARRTFSFGTCEYGIAPPMSFGLPVDRAPALAGAEVEFIAPSNWSRQGFLRCGVKPERVWLVPHGVDTAIFRPASDEERAAERTRLGWDEWNASFVYLSVGAMIWNKGISVLLAAFAAVLEKHPGALLALKGIDSMYQSGDLVNAWLSKLPGAAAARVRARIVYVGKTLTSGEVAAMHRAADAYVCPYRAEGFNVPALEGAASGLPVICTAGGPTDDFVRPEFARKIKAEQRSMGKAQVGFYLEPSVESTAGQMLSVIGDRTFREEAREAGPAHVRANYTWAKVVEQLVGVMCA